MSWLYLTSPAEAMTYAYTLGRHITSGRMCLKSNLLTYHCCVLVCVYIKSWVQGVQYE